MQRDLVTRGFYHAVVTACVACATFGAKDAFAQDKKGADDKTFEGPLKEQLEEYWAVDRDLPMIKDRLFELDGRFGLGVMAGVTPSEPFYVYVPLGGRLSYFFANELGVEVSGSYMLSFNTQLNDFLAEKRAGGFNPELDTEDKFIWNAEAVVSWHPLYGKWALLQRKLSHLDFSFALGAGAIGMTRPDVNRANSIDSIQPALVFGAGLGFFLGEKSLLRFDWRSRPYVGPAFETAQYEEQTFISRVQVPTELTLGYTFLF